ncbi:hypothetical protein H5P11_004947, partial [Escherichia coli]|nr:hypothetical protein [Escherichia coli]
MKKTLYSFFFGSGFSDIKDTALNSAISGSIFPFPLACFVMRMALPFGSTLAFPTHQA